MKKRLDKAEQKKRCLDSTFWQKNLEVIKKKRIFAAPNFIWSLSNILNWSLSSVGSERLPYKQRVGGSNPSATTQK